MKFVDIDWQYEAEPSLEVITAAIYLESRGYNYPEHFDEQNALELAEAIWEREGQKEKQP